MKLKRLILYPFLNRCPVCSNKALHTYKSGTYSCRNGAGGALYSTICIECDTHFKGNKKSGWVEHYETETESYEIKDIIHTLENEGWEKIMSHVSQEDAVEIYEYRKQDFIFSLLKEFDEKRIALVGRKRDIELILSLCDSVSLREKVNK